MTERLRVLFLCTGNSCRSQMAEGFCRGLWDDLIEAHSAGLEAHGLNPDAVRVMDEIGMDISRQRSKTVAELGEVTFDYVVTVCGNANESCPIFPAKVRVVHQGFEDPSKMAATAKNEEEALDCYRRVRDQIRDFILTLPEALFVRAPADDDKPSCG